MNSESAKATLRARLVGRGAAAMRNDTNASSTPAVDSTTRKPPTIKDLLASIKFHENCACVDFERYLHRLHARVVRQLMQKLQEHRNVKAQLQIDAIYEKLKPKFDRQKGGARRTRQQQRSAEEEAEDEESQPTKRPPVTLVTKLTPVLSVRDVRTTVDNFIATLRERHINALQNGSRMVMREIKLAQLNVARYEPLAGRRYCALPDFLLKKHAVINVHNFDSRCFGYAILSAKLGLGNQ